MKDFWLPANQLSLSVPEVSATAFPQNPKRQTPLPAAVHISANQTLHLAYSALWKNPPFLCPGEVPVSQRPTNPHNSKILLRLFPLKTNPAVWADCAHAPNLSAGHCRQKPACHTPKNHDTANSSARHFPVNSGHTDSDTPEAEIFPLPNAPPVHRQPYHDTVPSWRTQPGVFPRYSRAAPLLRAKPGENSNTAGYRPQWQKPPFSPLHL